MPVRIKRDDGALGKSLTIKAQKSPKDGVEYLQCECNVQMTVNRRQLEKLAGLPEHFADAFYEDDTGAPFADVELAFLKRELTATGKFSRGDEGFEAYLPVRKAQVTGIRFKLEPDGGIFIGKYAWRAAGDEVESAEHLLGHWVQVEVTFTEVVAQQQKLDLPDSEPAAARPNGNQPAAA